MNFLYYMIIIWVMAASWVGPFRVIFDDISFMPYALLTAYFIVWITLGCFYLSKLLSTEKASLLLKRILSSAITAVLSGVMLLLVPSLAILAAFFTFPAVCVLLVHKIQVFWRNIAIVALWNWTIILALGYVVLWTTPDGISRFTGQDRAYATRALQTEECYGLGYDNRINGAAKQVISVEVSGEGSVAVEVQTYTWMRIRRETVLVAFDGLAYTCAEING